MTISTHPVIPIASATAATACATGEVTIVAGSCSAAASCSSGSSCSAGGGTDANDPSAKLAQEGWVLRTTIGEPRLSEVVDNYRAMGYEVHVERLAPAPAATAKTSEGDACTTCFDADPNGSSQQWGSVYVRQGHSQKLNDDLY